MIKVDEDFIPVQKRFANQYNLNRVLKLLNNPQNKIPTINIVGTNGKGSTSFYLSQGLKQKYKKVGLFISPAFLYQNERIQINNQMISDDNLHFYLNQILKYIQEFNLTFFEIWTLIMILYFSDQQVDIAVIEAGIGGIHDSTNLMSNQLLTLLTSVSYDHTDVLGENISEILTQKVLIVKDNTPLIVSADNQKYFDQIKIILKDNHRKNINLYQAKIWEDKVDYQQANKGLVIEALKYFQINNYEQTLSLNPPLGRFTVLKDNPYLIIDGAHNIDAIKKLFDQIKKINQDFIVLFASSSHKDFNANLHQFEKIKNKVYITSFNHLKSWDINLVNWENKIQDWQEFLQKNKDKNIIVCGSLYFIPQVYQWFSQQKGE